MNEQQNTEHKKPIQEDEIDLTELTRVIWSRREFILKVTGVFVFLGLIVAFTSKVEYEASCKLMPENQEGMRSGLGGLSGLAGLAGINLDMGTTGTLTPMLYPQIVQSIPFQLELINEPILFQKLDSTMSSLIYFKEIDSPSLFGLIAEYTIGLPGKIKQLLLDETLEIFPDNNNELIRLSKEDWELIERYRKRISVSVDDKTGVISLSTEMPDPYAAAKITDLVVKKLTEKITEYKIKKVRTNLEFIQERYKEAKKEYRQKQAQVANFMDRNKNLTSSLVQTEYQRLQNELNIAFEVYKGLATQLEQAKIKVKEETPVFTVLDPVKIPVSKSKPKRMTIILLSFFLGVFGSIGAALIVPIYDSIKG